jgi:L-fuculose-phosphate aldolase
MSLDNIARGHNKPEAEHRRDICAVGRWLYERGYVVACEGNLSVRLGDGRILATPTGLCKGKLEPEHLVILDGEGRTLCGLHAPSSELLMHLLFYRLRPDVQAVCHAHPPTATGFASAGRSLDQALVPEVIVTLGQVPLAPYGTPGTEELSITLEPFVPHYNAILMANHGAVTCGPDLLTAFFRMETVEQFARINLVTELLGGGTLLSRSEVEKLIAARARYGVALPEGAAPELPVTSETASPTSARIPLTRAELEALLEEILRRDRARR